MMEIISGILKYNKNMEKHSFNFQLNEGKYSNDDVRIIVEEKSVEDDYYLNVILVPKVELEIDDISIEMGYEFSYDDRIFVNGYQSWTESREFGVNERMKGFPFFYMPAIEGKYKLTGIGDYKFMKYSGKKGVLHGYTYTYVRDKDDYLVLIGSLSEKNGFTVFKCDTHRDRIIIAKDCAGLNLEKGEYKIFELAFIEGNESAVFKKYFGMQNMNAAVSAPLTGWTSWYNYYNDITEKTVLENLDNFASRKIPVDCIQIDDGYQKAVGDWMSVNDKFPGGMKNVSDRIREKGYKAGIWIAPFVCEENSDLFREHNDWILKYPSGDPVYSGFYDRWSGNHYSLDVYNSGFREYLRRVFDVICNKWNFDLIKADFIYGAAVIPRKDRTRSGIIGDAVDFLNEISGGKTILGCGIPLGAAFGKIPYCRIGPDVSLFWEDARLKKINYRERVSTVSSLGNTISRRHMNGTAFGNDPDVFILRNDNVGLNANQKHTLFLTNLIFGSLLFTSDNIAGYDEETYRMYCSAFPLKPKEILEVKSTSKVTGVVFKIGGLTYRTYINLTGLNLSLKLDGGTYYGLGEIIAGDTYLTLGQYESVCFLKLGDDDGFEIAGGTASIFPGSEIDDFKAADNAVSFSVNPKTVNKGAVLIRIPSGLSEAVVNGKTVKAEKTEGLNLIKISI
jgi:alpha-galactosidase